MLRLQRSSRDKLISIFVRDKDKFFSKPLVIAFAIAFGFHLFLLLMFHVSPFILSSGDVIFPPATVVADAVIADQGAVAVIDSSSHWMRGLPRPPDSSPSIKGTPSYTISRPISKGGSLPSGDFLFTSLEQSLYVNEFNPLRNRESPPFALAISGVLASLPVKDGYPKPEGITGTVEGETRAVFNVMVDGRTGKIFWYDFVEKSSKTRLDKFAENALAGMTFETNHSLGTLSGEIEFHFRGGKQ